MDSNADMITLQNADNEHEIHFAGTSPQIVVDGTAEAPYYNILYVDTITGETYVGFGSYELENVFQWLEEYFGETRAKIVDPDSYRPTGRWEECDWVEYDGHDECVHYPHKGCVCTNCRNAFKKEFVHNPRVECCPHCGAKMTDNKGETNK